MVCSFPLFAVLAHAAAEVKTCEQADETSLLQGFVRQRTARAENLDSDTAELQQHAAVFGVLDEAQASSNPYVFPTPKLPALTKPDETTAAPNQPNPDDSNLMELVLLDEATYGDIGGRCLDGQMAGYYYGRGTNNLWLIYFKGGGGCQDKKGCDNWIKSHKASDWTPTFAGDGLLNSSTPDADPEFRNAHRVWIPYCTGDNRMGQVVTPIDGCQDGDPDCIDQFGMYFSGHLNFRNIMHHILSNQPDSRAMTQVLLTGSSAGAQGVVATCDWLGMAAKKATFLPNLEVSCAPFGTWNPPGYASDMEDEMRPLSIYSDFTAGTPTPLEGWEEVFSRTALLQNRYISPNCRTAYPGEEWKCTFPFLEYPTIGPRMFMATNIYDSTFLGGLGISNKFKDNAKKPTTLQCADEDLHYLDYAGTAWVTSLQSALKPDDGLWMPACYAHTGNIMPKGEPFLVEKTIANGPQAGQPKWVDSWVNSKVQGTDSLQATTEWFFRRNAEQIRLVDDCGASGFPAGVPCNPTCGYAQFCGFALA